MELVNAVDLAIRAPRATRSDRYNTSNLRESLMLFAKKEQELFDQLTPEQQATVRKFKRVLEKPWFNLIAGAICGAIGMYVGLWLTEILIN